jgi:hypothetical protein
MADGWAWRWAVSGFGVKQDWFVVPGRAVPGWLVSLDCHGVSSSSLPPYEA